MTSMERREWNNEFVMVMLRGMPANKRRQLCEVLDANAYLTSFRGINYQVLHVYKEGWYIDFVATRRRFTVWVADNDGEFVFGFRKPRESKLHKLYATQLSIDECQFCSLYN